MGPIMTVRDVLISVFLSGVSGYLYWVGGQSKDVIKWANTKWRDFGIPTCVIAWFLLNGYHNTWALLVTFLFTFGAQTSYFKKKGTDSGAINWLFVGLAFSLALIPMAIQTGNWHGFLYRSLITTIFTVIWSESISIDWLEESGRGFIQLVTLSLLTIGGKV